MNGNVIKYNEGENNRISIGAFCKRYLIDDPVSFFNYIQNDFYLAMGRKKYLRFKGSSLKKIQYDSKLVFFENDLSQLDLARKAEKQSDGLGLKNVRVWQVSS